MPYKYDLHVHTGTVSRCAPATSEEAARDYAEAGYAGFVSTNHFSIDSFRHMEDRPRIEWAEHFIRGFEELREAGARRNLTVLLGMELRMHCNFNDYLVYGLTEEFFREFAENLLDMNAHSFHKLASEHNLLFCQAHPFRPGMTVTNPADLDGIEVRNGCPRHNSSNDIAKAWAAKYNLIGVGGSDYHVPTTADVPFPVDRPNSGIEVEEKICDNETLVKILRSGNYKLIEE